MLLLVSSAYGLSEEERKFLLLYFDEEDLVVVSATRSLKSISRVAENVEVISAADIELMNAHTVAEVLNGVTGVQVMADGGPGTIATALILGSEFRHVAVFLDGILLNNLSDNFADIGAIPVQMIARIEVIKGPASSVWGSSLGGVINIITKAADATLPGGLISASLGQRASGDFRAEMFGKKGNFGYYLYAGRLQTDGLTPGFDVDDNHIYTKLTYKLADRTDIFFTLFYQKNNIGDGAYKVYDVKYRNRSEQLLTTLSLKSQLSSETDLNVSLRSAMGDVKFFVSQLSDGAGLFNSQYRDNKYGASAQLTWRHGIHSMVFGTDYDKGILHASTVSGDAPELRKIAFFANDTIELGKFSLTPGIRYDNTNISDDFISPSLGITYRLENSTILRAFVSRGFNNPALNWTSASSELFEYKANPDLKTAEDMVLPVGRRNRGLEICMAEGKSLQEQYKRYYNGRNYIRWPIFLDVC
jgi:vitamin B12 transporter